MLNTPVEIQNISGAERWWLAIRPKTLGASIAPVIVGTAIASTSNSFSILVFLLTALGAMLLQIEANLVNDYFDFKKGADTHERLGPLRVTSAGLISPKKMKQAISLVALASVLNGALLVALTGWPLLILGIVSLIAAFLYTSGPFPLAYRGLGDVFVFIFFGPVAVMGAVYAQTLQWTSTAFVASLPIGALATAILVVNNLRDYEEDTKNNKKTLIVRIGKKSGFRFYYFLILSAFLSVFIGQKLDLLPFSTSVVLLAWLFDFRILRDVQQASGKAYNPLLARTAHFLVIFGILFALALVYR